MKFLIAGLIVLSCLVLIGCSVEEQIPSSTIMPSPNITLFKEYYVNYSIKDISTARCRWTNRDNGFDYGSINFTRSNFLINGEQSVQSDSYVGFTHILYVKHYSRDENFFSYNSVDDYALERFIDACNYDGVLYIDAFVCQTSNNNSTSVCYNLSDACVLRLWTDTSIDNANYFYGWSRRALDVEINRCIRDFDMVVD